MTQTAAPEGSPTLIIRRHPGANGFVLVPVKGDVVQAVDLDAEYDLFDTIEDATTASVGLSPSEVWVHTECFEESEWRDYFIFVGGTLDDEDFDDLEDLRHDLFGDPNDF